MIQLHAFFPNDTEWYHLGPWSKLTLQTLLATILRPTEEQQSTKAGFGVSIRNVSEAKPPCSTDANEIQNKTIEIQNNDDECSEDAFVSSNMTNMNDVSAISFGITTPVHKTMKTSVTLSDLSDDDGSRKSFDSNDDMDDDSIVNMDSVDLDVARTSLDGLGLQSNNKLPHLNPANIFSLKTSPSTGLCF